jgi:hypothetical protein
MIAESGSRSRISRISRIELGPRPLLAGALAFRLKNLVNLHIDGWLSISFNSASQYPTLAWVPPLTRSSVEGPWGKKATGLTGSKVGLDLL